MPDLLEHLAHLDLHARAHLVRAGCVPSPFEFCLRPDVLLNIVLHVLGLVLQLRREGAVAHARGVRLDHADNGVDLLRRDPQARTNAPDGRVRGRHEWIRAEVDIQQRGIGALDEDLVSSGDVLVDEGHRVDNLTPQDVGKLPVALDLLLDARDAALLAALGVEGGLRVVRHQGLSQLRLLLCVLLPRVAEALLRPSDQLSQPALELHRARRLLRHLPGRRHVPDAAPPQHVAEPLGPRGRLARRGSLAEFARLVGVALGGHRGRHRRVGGHCRGLAESRVAPQSLQSSESPHHHAPGGPHRAPRKNA
mmetsp:Transcript_26008/g.67732  ORF Transcript_26008/g.67732 Transcript_26008/m.67732 type:complete len:308 (-) Transcript_26008:524-1447(-)